MVGWVKPPSEAGGRAAAGRALPCPGVDTIPLPSPYAIYAAVALRLPTVNAGGPKPLLRRAPDALTPRNLSRSTQPPQPLLQLLLQAANQLVLQQPPITSAAPWSTLPLPRRL